MRIDHAVTPRPLPANCQLILANDSPSLSWDSPASKIFQDFTNGTLPVVSKHLHIDLAEKILAHTRPHLALVLNKQHELVGVLRHADILGEPAVQKLNGVHDELTVADLMQQRQNLLCLGRKELDHLTVAALAKSIERHHQNLLLVINEDNQVLGLVSLDHIHASLQTPPLNNALK